MRIIIDTDAQAVTVEGDITMSDLTNLADGIAENCKGIDIFDYKLRVALAQGEKQCCKSNN